MKALIKQLRAHAERKRRFWYDTSLPEEQAMSAMHHDEADTMEQAADALERQIADLAECYRLSGADPDGNEDWRLAPLAVQEVRRLREEYDADEAELWSAGNC